MSHTTLGAYTAEPTPFTLQESIDTVAFPMIFPSEWFKFTSHVWRAGTSILLHQATISALQIFPPSSILTNAIV